MCPLLVRQREKHNTNKFTENKLLPGEQTMISTKKLLTTAILGIIALSSFNTISNVQAGEEKVHWGYEGSENPSEWGKLSPEFVTSLHPFRTDSQSISQFPSINQARISLEVQFQLFNRPIPRPTPRELTPGIST